jgi:hypothetical protein
LEESRAQLSVKDDELGAKDDKLAKLMQQLDGLRLDLQSQAVKIEGLVNDKLDALDKLVKSQAAENQLLHTLHDRNTALADSNKDKTDALTRLHEVTAALASKAAVLDHLTEEKDDAVTQLQEATAAFRDKEVVLADLADENAEALAKLQLEHTRDLAVLREWIHKTVFVMTRVLEEVGASTDFSADDFDITTWLHDRLDDYLQGRLTESETHGQAKRELEKALVCIKEQQQKDKELQERNKKLEKLLERAHKLIESYKEALE